MTFIFDMKKSYAISKDLREICTNIYEICKNENQYIPQLFFGENEALSVSASLILGAEISIDLSKMCNFIKELFK